MFYYTISDNEYEDYFYTTLSHDTEFSKKEFCEMYNRIIEDADNNCSHHVIVEELSSKYGFKEIKVKYEINSCYSNHEKPISNELMTQEEDTFICED
ncbi:hypothetical protein NSQ20_12135 [Paenibacillus sp. FSL K6-1122]|uniref:hypothetical protein n=1 Tax=Paenibacillus sp. FSL K6-1122 TaxID=2954512 RepID=UPI0030EC7103